MSAYFIVMLYYQKRERERESEREGEKEKRYVL